MTEPRREKTPFQQVVDDMTGGCGCACHTGTGYNTSCEHCHTAAPAPAGLLREAAEDALTFIEQCYWEDDDEKALIEELTSDLRAALAADEPGLDVERLAVAMASYDLQSDPTDADRRLAAGYAAEYARLRENVP